MSEPILIKTFSNRFEADIAKSYLKQNDIESYVMADDAGGMLPPLSIIDGVKLYVRPEDEKKAGQLLKDRL